MFEYTKLVFSQTVDDIKKLSTVAQFATQGIYVAYLIYAVSVGTGILGVNIGLLVISTLYLAFSVVMKVKEMKKTDQKIKKNVKKAYKAAKHIIQVPTLAVAIITLATLESDHITFSLLFTVLMVLGYVVSILLSVITGIVENRAKKFMVAIEADIEPIMKVVNGVRKLKGDKIEEPEHDRSKEKMRSELDLVVNKNREEKKLREEAEREAKKEERKAALKSLAGNAFSKAKDKIKSLTAKKEKTLPEPEKAPEEKEPIEK